MTELALGPDAKRAKLAIDVAGRMREKCAEGLLLTVVKRSQGAGLRESALACLAWRASKDVTGELVALWPQVDAGLKKGLLEALSGIWVDEYGMRSSVPALPSRASEAELARWERELKALVVKAIGEGDKHFRDEAIELAGHLRIPEAVPLIDKATPTKNPDFSTPWALGKIGTDEAARVLLRLSHAEDASDRGNVLEALKEAPARRALPRLQELLEDRGETRCNDYRVCDRAADALAAILPKGPGFDIDAELAKRDAKIAAWRKYLKKALKKGE